jgi:uncharacterized membrane protein
MAEPESLATIEPLDKHVRRHHFDRLIMLSDGVFAIAVTLAAIELHVPGGRATLGEVLHDIRVPLMIYLVSFLVSAVFWIGNRDLFARLRRIDAVLTGLTLGMLAMVALIPAAMHFASSDNEITGSLRFYALVMIVCGGFNTAMWTYAGWRKGMMMDEVPRHYRIARAGAAMLLPVLFAPMLVLDNAALLTWLVPVTLLIAVTRRIVIPRLEKRSAGKG